MCSMMPTEGMSMDMMKSMGTMLTDSDVHDGPEPTSNPTRPRRPSGSSRRDLVKAGATDTLGLSAASFGWQARACSI